MTKIKNKSLLSQFEILFPVWVLITGSLAVLQPSLFLWFEGVFIVWGLSLIMLFMGMTLKTKDFEPIFKEPKVVLLGFILQYSLMPLLAWSICQLLSVGPEITLGFILVGSAPGGTASNVITFLARGSLPLSVAMTTTSTLLAVLITPLWVVFLSQKFLDVNGWKLLTDTATVVLFPIGLGIFLNQLINKKNYPKNETSSLAMIRTTHVQKIFNQFKSLGPSLAQVLIILIVSSILARSANYFNNSSIVIVFIIAILLHGSGFFLGYWITQTITKRNTYARTIAIEVGMQNSGLAAVLALQFSQMDPNPAVSCAISAFIHCLIGSGCALVWRRHAVNPPKQAAAY